MNRTGDVRRKKSEFSRPPIFRVFQHNRCKAAVPSLETVAALVRLAMILFMVKRLTKPSPWS